MLAGNFSGYLFLVGADMLTFIPFLATLLRISRRDRRGEVVVEGLYCIFAFSTTLYMFGYSTAVLLYMIDCHLS